MSKKVKRTKHPQVTGGEAGRGPGRGQNKLVDAAPGFKKGTRPTLPVRPVTNLEIPKRPKDFKKKKN